MAWLYKQAESSLWWIGYRSNGKQFRRSTGTADRKEAEAEMDKLELMEKAKAAGRLTEDFYRALSGSILPDTSLQDGLDKWLEGIRVTASPSTHTGYKGVADQLKEFMKADAHKPRLKDVTKDEIFRFLVWLKVAPSTANNRRTILAGFFNWAMEEKMVRENPCQGIQPFKGESKIGKVERRGFTMVEVAKLYDQCPNDFWRYMVLGELYSGLRLGDLICLRKKEINLRENTLEIEAFKVEDKTIKIPMAAPLRRAIEARITELGKIKDGDFLWPEQAAIYYRPGKKNNSGQFSNEFYQLVLEPLGMVPPRATKKKNKGKAGRSAKRILSDVSFHSLRHSFISMLKASGASQSVAKELAGHSSDAVSDLYTHTSLDVLTKAIGALPEVTA